MYLIPSHIVTPEDRHMLNAISHHTPRCKCCRVAWQLKEIFIKIKHKLLTIWSCYIRPRNTLICGIILDQLFLIREGNASKEMKILVKRKRELSGVFDAQGIFQPTETCDQHTFRKRIKAIQNDLTKQE
jgi:hypothetical protein